MGARVVELLATERAASEDEDATDHGDEYIEAHQCPVCEYWGYLSGPVSRGDANAIENDHFFGWEVERTWYPDTFACEVCGLVLDSKTLYVAGFPDSQELDADEATPDEVQEIYTDLRAEYDYYAWRDEHG